MKLSRTAWNNVIIFIVMGMILLINLTNNKLFPDQNGDQKNDKGEQFILSEHAVILTLTINEQLFIERIGQSWQIKSANGQLILDQAIKAQALEQVMLAWQNSIGLIQAPNIEISGIEGIEVVISLAGQQQSKRLTLYPLSDQLLIKEQVSEQEQQWLALSTAIYPQIMPNEFVSYLQSEH